MAGGSPPGGQRASSPRRHGACNGLPPIGGLVRLLAACALTEKRRRSAALLNVLSVVVAMRGGNPESQRCRPNHDRAKIPFARNEGGCQWTHGRVMVDRAIGIAGLALTLICAAVLLMFPNASKRLAWVGLVVGVLLLGVAGGLLFVPTGAQTTDLPGRNGNCNSNGDHNTYTNNNCSSTFVEPRYAQIGQATIDGIRQRIPAVSHVTVVTAVQDAPAAKMAQNLVIVPKQMGMGYDVNPMVAAAPSYPYFRGLQVVKQGGAENDYDLMVGDQRVQ